MIPIYEMCMKSKLYGFCILVFSLCVCWTVRSLALALERAMCDVYIKFVDFSQERLSMFAFCVYYIHYLLS